MFAAVNEEALFDLEVRLLLEALFQRYHHDFREYAMASVRRRVRQAMQRLDCERVADLQHRILHEPDAFAQALPFFTVQVSEMFRDPAYFLALREHVVPVLRTYPSLKLWVAGCSHGEEVWSLAILLHEEGSQISADDWPLYLDGMNGPHRMGVVRDELRKRRYSQAQIDKLMGNNVRRLYRDVIG